MSNAPFQMAGKQPSIRSWGCIGPCCKDKKKPTETFYNNATKMECRQCGSKPSPKCFLFGKGGSGKRERWKKDNGTPPVSQPSPSQRPPAQQAVNDKRAADKAKKEIEDLKKKVKSLEAGGAEEADEAAPSGPQAAIGQALKAKIEDLAFQEKQLKSILAKKPGCELYTKLVEDTQAELAHTRGLVRMAKPLADIVHDETKLISSMEKEYTKLVKDLDKARDEMDEAEAKWHKIGQQALQKAAKIKESKQRQQEALNQQPAQGPGKPDMATFQTMLSSFQSMATASIDAGVCSGQEQQQLQMFLQTLSGGAQLMAQMQGKLQQQQVVATKMVDYEAEMRVHQERLDRDFPPGGWQQASTQPGSVQLLGGPVSAPLPGSVQLLEPKPLDANAIAKGTAQAMEKAMGSQYVAQPDHHRKPWADTPAGDDDWLEEAIPANGLKTVSSIGSSGTVLVGGTGQLAHPFQGVAPDQPMAVDTTPVSLEDAKGQQEAIEADIRDKAKAASRSQAGNAAGGKQTPPRDTSPEAIAAELKARPPRAAAV